MSEREFGETILAVNNIGLSFGVMKVLDNISFDIKRGEIRSHRIVQGHDHAR